MTRSSLALLVLFGFANVGLADNWPAWRGPRGDGHCQEKALPMKWTSTDNVRWRIPLPAPGNSTPIIWRNRILLTQATENGRKRALYCLSRTDGKQLWKAEITYKEKESTHSTNPYCSASPVTDGERVIVSHGSAGLFCYDLDGKELWKKETGKQEHIWGNASSPVFFGEMVYLWVGPGENQVLLALDRKDGQTIWQHREPGGKSGSAGNTEWIGSWSTPLIARIGQREELLLSVPNVLRSFDPRTGKQLWFCEGLTKLVYTSPLCSPDGIVLAMSGFHGAALAVRANGAGNITKTHRLWHHATQNPQRIGSGVIVAEHAYLINEQGLGQCFELKTGKDLWHKERVTGPTWSSLLAAGDRLYIVNDRAETVVLAASPDLKVLGKNPLDGATTRASIAVSDGELFIRTYKHLWCIGTK
jgi:outer membrane protein assembly factor BamB